MKKIFMSGLTAFLMLGLAGLIFKLVVVDLLAQAFRPLILLFAPEYLVIPLTVVFTVVLIFLFGIPASHIKFQAIIIKFLERMLPKENRGVLVKKSGGSYDLAIIIKKIKFLRLDGSAQTLCLLFYPSTPVVWTSALPIGLAREGKLIPIESSLVEIYTIITTYGRNAPNVIREIENKKGTE